MLYSEQDTYSFKDQDPYFPYWQHTYHKYLIELYKIFVTKITNINEPDQVLSPVNLLENKKFNYDDFCYCIYLQS